jgi:hypothetical protein
MKVEISVPKFIKYQHHIILQFIHEYVGFFEHKRNYMHIGSAERESKCNFFAS